MAGGNCHGYPVPPADMSIGRHASTQRTQCVAKQRMPLQYSAHFTGPSNPSRRRVTIARHEIPLDLLVAKHDPRKLPKHVVASEENIRRVNKDFAWSSKREHLLAAAAAGVHLALFAYNLAFWGFEGMPPDR